MKHGPISEPHTRTTTVISYLGNQDAIRFGVLLVDGHKRGYFYDALSRSVRLYRQENGNSDQRVEDRHSERRALAKALLDARWAEERRLAG